MENMYSVCHLTRYLVPTSLFLGLWCPAICFYKYGCPHGVMKHWVQADVIPTDQLEVAN